MKTDYTVHAKRWARGWELHIDGVGVTQARRLSDAEVMVRDYLSLELGNPPGVYTVEIIPEVGDGLDAEVREVRKAARAAEEAQKAAAARSRALACELKSRGLTGREIAAVLKVSTQRVSQLLRAC
jgi:hypothetical protein